MTAFWKQNVVVPEKKGGGEGDVWHTSRGEGEGLGVLHLSPSSLSSSTVESPSRYL